MSRHALAIVLLAATTLGGCATAQKLTTVPPSVTVACADRPFGFEDNDTFTDYGCATARNIAAMAAYPSDLEGGHEAGPPRGDGALLAVQRHDKGQSKPLPTTTTGSPAPASGSGSNSGSGGKAPS